MRCLDTETHSDFKKELRPKVKGKFIFVGDQKLFIKGVTYGTFCSNNQGEPFPEPEIVEHDFAQIAAHGMNAVRTYTFPPIWLLDIAYRYHLQVIAGLPWEQHIAFLDDRQYIQQIEERVRAGARSVAGHLALLGYAVGNEIPASIVRWYGQYRIQAFLKRLYCIVKAEDSNSLVTYVNYPSTEYLHLPFIDFVCFNVYLETKECLEAYLARLQTLAGERPLVMAEIGLDSLRHGEATQATTLDWQIRTVFEAGCAGCFIFAWTDEWHRGGFEIKDWDFGLTDRQRRPKLALKAVHQALSETPAASNRCWPRISVAICSYNGARTIRDPLDALQRLEYPDYEVIVVDDGSQDGMATIVKEYDVQVIVHPQNQGLSCARNTALSAATGEIIAYIDDDAYPDPHWLTYLAISLMNGEYAAVGGPNIPPLGDGWIADCIANAPGGPTHVLLSDQVAEHIPGCNMAFWKARLQDIGGFDPRFRAAGDDVDICWRLQQQGWTIGFSPAAVVWHHRRNSLKAYWRQQRGYGKAEALLEAKWPEKYNAIGHLNWSGRIYGRGLVELLPSWTYRIYYGTWGSAPFQSIYQPAPNLLSALPAMPEWYLVILVLMGLASLGTVWQPMLWTIPLLAFVVAAPMIQAARSVSHAVFTTPTTCRQDKLKLYGLTTLLYLLQPLARLWGRLENGLTPWRQRGFPTFKVPIPRSNQFWSESWQSSEQWLAYLDSGIREQGPTVRHGGDFDPWDLEIRSGLLGAVRVLMAIEEHGAGKQLIRFRTWPRVVPLVLGILGLLVLLAVLVAWDRALIPAAVLGTMAILLAIAAIQDCAIATATYLQALNHVEAAAGCQRMA